MGKEQIALVVYKLLIPTSGPWEQWACSSELHPVCVYGFTVFCADAILTNSGLPAWARTC